MKRLLILLGLMFFCMAANANVIGLNICPAYPFKFALLNNITSPVKPDTGLGNDVVKHDRQVGATIHLSSIPE